LFADLGARILVGDVRAGAVVTWVSGLDGDGVVGQLTISQRPRSLNCVHGSSLASLGLVLR